METQKEIFVDAGTTWTKILTVSGQDKSYEVIPSSKLKELNLNITKCTGHSLINKSYPYENEVVALAQGAKKYLEDNFIALDLGSRDIKYVRFQNKKFKDMDWNTSCAAATGATVEMLLKFYDLKADDLIYTKEKYVVTCGIFGLERIMDDISKGTEAKIAVSKFIHGIAFNAYNFAKNPEKICISGGFCENKCFIDCLKQYCEVLPLGRFILTEGLYYSTLSSACSI